MNDRDMNERAAEIISNLMKCKEDIGFYRCAAHKIEPSRLVLGWILLSVLLGVEGRTILKLSSKTRDSSCSALGPGLGACKHGNEPFVIINI
jgi:hypothetical protein